MKFKLDFNLDRNPTLAQIRSLPTAGRYGVIALAILAAYFDNYFVMDRNGA